MDNLLNMISSVNDEKSHNDNMYVNNIIVKFKFYCLCNKN